MNFYEFEADLRVQFECVEKSGSEKTLHRAHEVVKKPAGRPAEH